MSGIIFSSVAFRYVVFKRTKSIAETHQTERAQKLVLSSVTFLPEKPLRDASVKSHKDDEISSFANLIAWTDRNHPS
jgi:hypothetical protein